MKLFFDNDILKAGKYIKKFIDQLIIYQVYYIMYLKKKKKKKQREGKSLHRLPEKI